MSTTPFGRPLVPLEYGISATGRRASRAAADAGPRLGEQRRVDTRPISSAGARVGELARDLASPVAVAAMPVTAPPAVIAASATPTHGAVFGRLHRQHVARPEAAGGEQRATRSTRSASSRRSASAIATRSAGAPPTAATSSWNVVPPASTGSYS